jgi:hypothetical protein
MRAQVWQFGIPRADSLRASRDAPDRRYTGDRCQGICPSARVMRPSKRAALSGCSWSRAWSRRRTRTVVATFTHPPGRAARRRRHSVMAHANGPGGASVVLVSALMPASE